MSRIFKERDLTNDIGISIVDAFKGRFEYFFSFKNASVLYKIFKFLSVVVFIVPFAVFSILEFIVLTGFKFVGFSLEFVFKVLHLSLIWLPIGLVFGFGYILLNHVFWLLWLICNFVDAIDAKDAGYPYAKRNF